MEVDPQRPMRLFLQRSTFQPCTSWLSSLGEERVFVVGVDVDGSVDDPRTQLPPGAIFWPVYRDKSSPLFQPPKEVPLALSQLEVRWSGKLGWWFSENSNSVHYVPA